MLINIDIVMVQLLCYWILNCWVVYVSIVSIIVMRIVVHTMYYWVNMMVHSVCCLIWDNVWTIIQVIARDHRL